MIDKTQLILWMKKVDKKMCRKITIVAVGGTAMTLLGLKPSTRDIDFCISSEDKQEFEKAIDKNFKVDLFFDGYIFSEQLPTDYAEKSKEILKLKNIILKILSPEDIVITKSARFNARDEEDIQSIAKYVKRTELIERFKQVIRTYAGREEDYRMNFEVVLKRYFQKGMTKFQAKKIKDNKIS
ncbi:hypothetical protein HYT51_01835 [Candidatus Woesearchaeota archaeon]|nr:hypothetical protein [Candidatus Woesearchaeota archaeon]